MNWAVRNFDCINKLEKLQMNTYQFNCNMFIIIKIFTWKKDKKHCNKQNVFKRII